MNNKKLRIRIIDGFRVESNRLVIFANEAPPFDSYSFLALIYNEGS